MENCFAVTLIGNDILVNCDSLAASRKLGSLPIEDKRNVGRGSLTADWSIRAVMATLDHEVVNPSARWVVLRSP